MNKVKNYMNKKMFQKKNQNFEKRSRCEEEKKRKQKNLEDKKDNLKRVQMRANQNERNKTNLESKVGSENLALIDEENKISKDNLVNLQLKNVNIYIQEL